MYPVQLRRLTNGWARRLQADAGSSGSETALAAIVRVRSAWDVLAMIEPGRHHQLGDVTRLTGHGPGLLGRRGIGRLLLASLALPALQGCAAPLAKLRSATTTADAQALLAASAAAHGSAALATVQDISVRYAGHWRGLVGTLVPVLADEGFRGGSEERLLLRDRIAAQAYTGPSGRKDVVRQTTAGGQGTVRVWYNGEQTRDAEQRDAAALVADGYSLFLLGPMLLAGQWAADRASILELGSPERITVGGQAYDCDVIRARITPGIGLSDSDDLALFIDRPERLMRRVRFTLNGLDATKGAVADVDAWGHVAVQGVRWPTRFHEQLLRPLPLPVHDWQMEGLDLNRGLTQADVDGDRLSFRAATPAASLPAV